MSEKNLSIAQVQKLQPSHIDDVGRLCKDMAQLKSYGRPISEHPQHSIGPKTCITELQGNLMGHVKELPHAKTLKRPLEESFVSCRIQDLCVQQCIRRRWANNDKAPVQAPQWGSSNVLSFRDPEIVIEERILSSTDCSMSTDGNSTDLISTEPVGAHFLNHPLKHKPVNDSLNKHVSPTSVFVVDKSKEHVPVDVSLCKDHLLATPAHSTHSGIHFHILFHITG